MNTAYSPSHMFHRILQYTAMRPKLQPQNTSWQISSINRVVIHVLTQKPPVDTSRNDNCVLSVRYALRWIDVCVCVSVHSVWLGMRLVPIFHVLISLAHLIIHIHRIGLYSTIALQYCTLWLRRNTSCFTWQIPATRLQPVIIREPTKNENHKTRTTYALHTDSIVWRNPKSEII